MILSRQNQIGTQRILGIKPGLLTTIFTVLYISVYIYHIYIYTIFIVYEAHLWPRLL